MITVTVQSLTPDGVVRRAVSAEYIKHALKAASGEPAGAAVVFPADGVAFFGPAVAGDATHCSRAVPRSPRAQVAPREGAGYGPRYRARQASPGRGQEGGAATQGRIAEPA